MLLQIVVLLTLVGVVIWGILRWIADALRDEIDCASKMPSSLAQFFNDSAFVGLLSSKRAD
jgi:hypothetical protein